MDPAFHIGDRVICRIHNGFISHHQSTSYDFDAVFEIIDNDFENGFLVYVPVNLPLKDAIYIDSYNIEWYKLDKKFLDSEVIHIADHHIVRIYAKCDGMKCVSCKTFVPMAEANEGNVFRCWSCRNYRIYL